MRFFNTSTEFQRNLSSGKIKAILIEGKVTSTSLPIAVFHEHDDILVGWETSINTCAEYSCEISPKNGGAAGGLRINGLGYSPGQARDMKGVDLGYLDWDDFWKHNIYNIFPRYPLTPIEWRGTILYFK